MIVHIFTQTNEEQDLVYAVPNITQRKLARNNDAEKEGGGIYADVREYSGEAD